MTEGKTIPEPTAPGHTDLMVSPESIDAFLEANPLPPEPPVSGWRDISTAPKRDRKKRTDVLLGSFPKGAIAVGEAHRPPRDCFTTMDGTYHAPTHWHPLPTPPKQQEPK